ncbi:MAG: CDGSH iron-sulfur domain-containing protein [Rugosibacter sp.]|nr:CDGSH iron-sulfur domain-containing protein [Rugosibacter sp.]
MTNPEITATSPFAVAVEAGEDYYWCSCGKSSGQPFCDGKPQRISIFAAKIYRQRKRNSLLLRLQAQQKRCPLRRLT